MKARTFKTLTDSVFSVSLYTEDWSQNDLDLMEKYSEPEIDLGGIFETPDFTLPGQLVRIKSDAPFHMSFDKNDFADAEERAGRWATDILARLASAIADLRTQSDTFTDESVVTI